jgi:hypothetical protein
MNIRIDMKDGVASKEYKNIVAYWSDYEMVHIRLTATRIVSYPLRHVFRTDVTYSYPK